MNEEIIKIAELLKKGKVILYPTDTIWGIGCDATQPKPVEKIYKIKQRFETKSMIILLDNPDKLGKYVKNVPPVAFDLMERYLEPLTIIYPNATNLAKNVIAADGTVGIRIVKDEFCRELIHQFDKPIVSTSANLSGQPSPIVYSKISDEIKKQVDYIANYHQDKMIRSKPSTIIRLLGGAEFEVLRK